MGMHTIMEGSFEIEPPLTHQELKKLNDINLKEIYVKISQEETETDEGTLIKRSGTEICLVDENSRVNNYLVSDELQKLFDLFYRISGADHDQVRSFNGSIFCIYEEIEGLKFIPIADDDPTKGKGFKMVPTIEGVWRYEESYGRLVTKYPIVSGWSEKKDNSNS